MKLFRYCKPSLKKALGITKIKRKVNKITGKSMIKRYSKSRIKSKIKNKVGFSKKSVIFVRNAAKNKIPTFLGIFGKKNN